MDGHRRRTVRCLGAWREIIASVNARCDAEGCNEAPEWTACGTSVDGRINSELLKPTQNNLFRENGFSIRSPPKLDLPLGEAVVVRYMDYRAERSNAMSIGRNQRVVERYSINIGI